jgi:lysozyme
LINGDFNRYAIWLQFYGDQKTDPLEDLKLKGPNPWTVWQHSNRGRVPGISGKVDLDVFFGSKKALEEYAGGIGGNPALQAASQR